MAADRIEGQKKGTRSKARLYTFCACIALAEIMLSYYMQMHMYRDADIPLHVNTAVQILHGEVLYRDIINIGFPMQFYLRIPQVWLAETLGINALHTALVFDNIFACVTLVLMLVILSRLPFAQARGQLWLPALVLIYALFVFPVFTCSMGEKEYYIWIFTLPYFALAAARTEGVLFSRYFRFLVGLLAAIGFSYKPVTAIPLLLVEGYLCLQARSFRSLLRAELVICVLFNCAYLLWMFFALSGYREVMLPLAKFYLEMRIGLQSLLLRFFLSLWLQCLLLERLRVYMRRDHPPLYHYMNVWCIATLGYMVACVVQMKGFWHHFYPVNAMMLTLFAVAYAVSRRYREAAAPGGFWASRRVTLLAGLGLVILLEQTCCVGIITHVYEGYALAFDDHILEHALDDFKRTEGHPAKGIYELSQFADPMFPEGMYLGLPWDYHFNNLWLMNGLEKFKERHAAMPAQWIAEQTRPAERFLRTTVTEDIARQKPDIIITILGNDENSDDKNPVDYFIKDPAFARVFSDYRFQSRQHAGCVYFRRQAPP